ncbi:MAG: hypothetical protein IPM46_16205 [Flavobacteriales bacterium]|nr:hypothetical protein [Flavobacteriales bacterium]
MLRTARILVLASFGAWVSPMSAAGDGCGSRPSLNVQCSRSSAFVQVNVANCRRIGKVVLEVRDKEGRVLYHEEGKALAEELVRRLDKGLLPRGTHTVTVAGRDLALSQPFTVE